MNAYRLPSPPPRYQSGTRVRVISNRLAASSVAVGDIGTLKYEIFRDGNPAGWVVQFGWSWRINTVIALVFDLLFLGWLWRAWGYFGCGILRSHLFNHQLELLGEE